jgi:hypothetical protein
MLRIASAWADAIQSDVESCSMPPPDAGVLSASDRPTLVGRIVCGPNDD